jgi:hypothetical protein
MLICDVAVCHYVIPILTYYILFIFYLQIAMYHLFSWYLQIICLLIYYFKISYRKGGTFGE